MKVDGWFAVSLASLAACTAGPPEPESVDREAVPVDPGEAPDRLGPRPQLLDLDVCADGPYTTITDALAVASPGAVIHICAGLYTEQLEIRQPVSLVGAGADQTILDGGGTGRVLRAERTSVSIEGVTIQHGLATSSNELPDWRDLDDDGGGIGCVLGTVRIADSLIRENLADDSGGGISGVGCTLALERVEVVNNRGAIGGGLRGTAFYDGTSPLVRSEVDIRSSRFADNVAVLGGGLSAKNGSLRFVGNLVEHNQAVSDENSGGVGGGALIESDDAELVGNRFVANIATRGGGLEVTGIAMMRDNEVAENRARYSGGGFMFGPGTYWLERDVVRNNVVPSGVGGGMSIYACDLTLAGVVVEGNRVSSHGGGVFVYSGDGLLSALKLDGAVVRNNVAGDSGGGIVITGGELRVRRSRIVNNQAARGGGIFAGYTTAPVELSNTTFDRNQSATDGGAVHVALANLQVTNVRFTANRAARGGAMWLSGLVDEENLHCWSCPQSPDVRVAQSTFADNHADTGAAIAIEGHRLTARGNIVAATSGGAQVAALQPSAVVVWQYNDTFPATFAGVADPTGTDGNLAADPRFLDELRLASDSPCIDAGPPELLDPDGTRADMGAFGGPGAP